MKNVLAAVDFSPVSDRVVEFAAKLAKVSNARLHLVHVASPEPDFVGYDVGPDSVRDQIARRFREEHRQLQSLADEVRDQGVDAKALLIQGPTVDKILGEAARLDSAHVVIGSHGRGAMGRLLLGSVSEGIVRHTHIPVTVIPSQPDQN